MRSGHERLLALGGDRRGVAIIEFALIAPMLLALLIATLQIALVMFAQECLQSAAEVAGRLVAVGAPQRSVIDATGFRRSICAELVAFVTCDRVSIDVRHFGDPAGLQTAAHSATATSAGFGVGRFDPGGPNSYNIIRLSYVQEVIGMPPTFDLADLGSGRKRMVATTVVKVEPYNS